MVTEQVGLTTTESNARSGNSVRVSVGSLVSTYRRRKLISGKILSTTSEGCFIAPKSEGEPVFGTLWSDVLSRVDGPAD